MSTTEHPRRGLFITFEGVDGSGKTTQMRLLEERLRAAGYSVIATLEPGGTSIGGQIRRILLDASNRELSPTTEMLLYFASRAQNVDECIIPALEAGQIVLSDRYTDSTRVYQGIARGLGEEAVLDLHSIACRGIDPNLTVLLDLDVASALHRTSERGQNDRIEAEASEFHRKIREAYLALASAEPERFRVMDGSLPIDTIADQVWRAVNSLLTGHVSLLPS
jgi:dTMP kinase